MTSFTDQQVLREYAERQREDAFAALVRRHIDFVYSAALRITRDPSAAEDVTQGVFVVLTSQAGELSKRPVLAGWLHGTARNLAGKLIRSEVRRRAREQEVAAMNALLAPSTDPDWEQIAPHLDAALGELGEADRDALLLRFFERKSAREMARTLGISDEAAQKRVTRAVERLREYFAKSGVTVGASGLAVVISANAVQAAPIGLAVTISTAAALAGTTLTTGTTATAMKAIAMTTTQKVLIAAAVVATSVGTLSVMLTPAEPSYQGKRLSEWLRSLDTAPLEFHSDLTVYTNHAAAQAILHMGSEAVPFLGRELRVRDSTVKVRVRELLARQSIIRVDSTPAHVRNRRATDACKALGTTAKVVIPELTALLDEHRVSPMARTSALAAMGPDALPSLMAALTNSEPEVRRCMATVIRNGSFDAEPTVPALVRCLSDPDDYHVRTEAAMALARIGKRPELVLPALRANLSDTNETVRNFTAMALRQFHTTSAVTN